MLVQPAIEQEGRLGGGGGEFATRRGNMQSRISMQLRKEELGEEVNLLPGRDNMQSCISMQVRTRQKCMHCALQHLPG